MLASPIIYQSMKSLASFLHVQTVQCTIDYWECGVTCVSRRPMYVKAYMYQDVDVRVRAFKILADCHLGWEVHWWTQIFSRSTVQYILTHKDVDSCLGSCELQGSCWGARESIRRARYRRWPQGSVSSRETWPFRHKRRNGLTGRNRFRKGISVSFCFLRRHWTIQFWDWQLFVKRHRLFSKPEGPARNIYRLLPC